MANSDSPQGLRPIKYLSGAPYNGAGNVYHVASGDGTIINPGDPVVLTGTADTRGIPTVTKATAGATNRITGVMISMTNGESTVLQDSNISTTTATSQYILVEDNPDVVYDVQCSGTLAVTDIGETANLLIPVSTVDGKSQTEIGAFAGLATSQVRVLRLRDVENNEVGLNANVEVVINLPTTANDTAGV
tara:strand:- start:126 stop:695 length:570 start_codon:yes stop_codon:yes gene_type:complete